MMEMNIILFICLAIFICIPVLVGIYVFRDARNRGMNAALWTLIAVLAPALIGFVIYLLVRSSYSDLKCPKCETAVTEEYVSCPNCGAKLKAACPNCSAPVEIEWKICPNCAGPLPESYEDVFAPTQKKDKTLGKILLTVILVPVLLILVTVFSFSAFSSSSAQTGITSLPIDDYLHETSNPQTEEWLNNCGKSYDKAYALRHISTSNGQVKTRYLVYLPCLTEYPQTALSLSSGLLSDILRLDIRDNAENGGGNTLLSITYIGDASPGLKFYYNDKKIDCEITDSDYPIE